MSIPKAPYAKCDECPLKDAPVVHGRGPDHPKRLIVGEAPGRQEVRSGIPFFGKSGQLMDKILSFHNIKREDVYVTNSVLCWPRDEDGKNRQPTTVELKACHERLMHEIKKHTPETILALGAVASKAVLETREGITSLRLGGPVYSESLDAHVVPTFHPAAALRDPDKFPSILSDVRKATRPVTVDWEPTKVTVLDDAQDAVRDTIDYCTNREAISLDGEWDAPYDWFNVKWLSLALCNEPGQAHVYTPRVINDGRFQQVLREFLHDTSIKWIMQHGKSDIKYLWSFAPEARVDEDSMYMHYATDERKGTHDLEQLVTEVLGGPFYKTLAKSQLARGESLASLPPDILYEYNGTDADCTYRLIEPLRKDMQNDGTEWVYENLLIPGSNALAHIEYPGVTLDSVYLEEIGGNLEQQLEKRETELKRWVDNPRSPQQIKRAFNEIIESGDLTTTRKEILENIIVSDKYGSEASDFAKAVLAYREPHKQLTTYVRGMLKHVRNGRIHSNFKLHGTETGRLSSSDPNLQNIPIGFMRGMITATTGRTLISADYEQLELRIAALEIPSPQLVEIFKAGDRHIHAEMASRLFGGDYYDADHKKKNEKLYRYAKNTNFGIIYDQREQSLALKLKIPVSKAKELINMWKEQVPELEAYFKRVRNEIQTKSYLTSRFGRKRRFWLITSDNALDVYREGYNFNISSPASDITLRALIKLEKDFRNEPGVDIVITVHDSIIIDCEEDKVEDVKQHVKRVMEDNPDFDIPILVDIKEGFRWGQ